MRNLVVVSFSVVVDANDADYVSSGLMDSEYAQMGYYTLGTSERDLTPAELKEVLSQVPDDIAADILQEDIEE